MYSKIVFAIPLISLLYLLQTIFIKSIKKAFRITLLIPALVVFLFDLLVSLYFFTSCYELSQTYGTATCLSWIYPTLDFKIMIVVSVLLLTLTLWGLISDWKSNGFYTMGSLVLYIGVLFRLIIFLQSIQVITSTGSKNPAIIFEFFTIMVVYGLVSAFIFFAIFSLSLFRARH